MTNEQLKALLVATLLPQTTATKSVVINGWNASEVVPMDERLAEAEAMAELILKRQSLDLGPVSSRKGRR